MSNSIMHITPYRDGRVWSFDDPTRKLKREPFVAGIPEIINVFVPKEQQTCDITFAGRQFPGAMGKLLKISDRPKEDGTVYELCAEGYPPLQGWLCPALFEYFEEAPEELWFKIE